MATIQNDITLPVNAICHVEYRGTSSYVYQDPESPELTTNSKTDSLRWTLRVNIGEARRETPAAYVIYHGGFTDNVSKTFQIPPSSYSKPLCANIFWPKKEKSRLTCLSAYHLLPELCFHPPKLRI